ncbi:MAG: fructosamine kinase family protein [Bacteroidota bacterium]
MDEAQMLQFISGVLLRICGKEVTVIEYRSVAGGCINNGTRVRFRDDRDKEQTIFLKWNRHDTDDLFEMEALGLQLLDEQQIFSMPKVVGQGQYMSINYLALSFIDSQPPRPDFWASFGQELAALHRISAPQYGFSYDNYIGRLPQKNTCKEDWVDFFIENRLEAQLGLALYNDHISRDFAKKFRLLYAQLPGLLISDLPSLLHGDLWSGNFMTDHRGLPAIIDPAVYYGNREIEIAFTQLFGGFDRQFYRSYHEAFPLEEGFQARAEIYNLYPLLVHVNLFGPSYLSGIESTIRRFV